MTNSEWSVKAGIDEIPDWVPAAVKLIALALPIWKARKSDEPGRMLQDGDEVGRRLLLDVRMRGVWKELRKYEVECLNYENRSEMLESWGIDDQPFSLQDKAFAAIFVRLLLRFCDRPVVATQAFADDCAKPYFDAAELCRYELQHGLFPHGALEPSELERALEIVAKHLEDEGNVRKGNAGNKLHIVDRSAKRRGDDSFRVGCRIIGGATRALFGRPLYGTVATIGNVVFDTQKITEKSVQNWLQ